ncbi:hypothetical protein BX666DRAFT_1511999 [Dichotomocladium elegans]|nr:hypothetical protein BX666DRAFT_1511999 [Dichotomocladium elegans]
MQHHWKTYRKTLNRAPADTAAAMEEAAAAAAMAALNGTKISSTAVASETEFLQAPLTANNGRSSSSDPSCKHSEPETYIVDPPPLDEALASYLLALMGRFLHQAHLIEEANDQQYSTPSEYPIDTFAVSIDRKQLALTMDIYRTAGRILYYASASNWSTYYAKIKNAVHILGAAGDGVEVNPPEIRMLEFSCLTRQRLHTVLSELSPYFLHMKRQGKMLFAKMMRKAIWRWIETYPVEFSEVCASNNRLLSGSEILFDMCNSAAESPRQKAIFWPLQTILLILSQDLLLQAFLDNPAVQTRRTSFLSTLRKSLKASKTADIAAICYVDICKAATYVWSFNRNLAADNAIASSLGYVINQEILITDYLLARLRLKCEETLQNLIPPCIEENVPPVFKIAFVKACLEIAREENRLPWNPSISSMYRGICDPLRKIFLQALNLEAFPKETPSTPILNSQTIRRPGNGVGACRSNSQHFVDLTQDLLRLFRVDSLSVLLGNDSDSAEDNVAIMAGMAKLFQHPDQTIRRLSRECLVSLHQVNNIMHWGSEQKMMVNFWRISSKVVFTLARQILDSKQSEEDLRFLLGLLIRLFEARRGFLRMNQNRGSEGADARERLQASVALEIALLVSLCSPDPVLCTDAIKCLGYLCEEAQLAGDDEELAGNNVTLFANIPIYAELASEEEVFLGRKAQQKRIRKYMRLISQHTPGSLAAWEEVWKRWKILTQMVNRQPEEAATENSAPEPVPVAKKGGKSKGANVQQVPARPVLPSATKIEFDEEKQTLWQNYTGFLASLGGCWLTSDYDINSGDLRRRSAPSEPPSLVDTFVGEMTNLLISDNIFIREGVKETLGSDLSVALYAILFRHLESAVSRCFSLDGEAIQSSRNTLLVEQATLILKIILDRIVDPNDSLLSVDFGTLTEYFARYINKLQPSFNSLRIKIKMCHLLEVLAQKREQIIIRNDIQLRNKLLEMIVEWTSDFSLQKPDVKSGPLVQDISQYEKLHRDLDYACLKAIEALLRQLPLQSSEVTRDAERNQVKSKLFYKYFTFFLKLLNRCRLAEIEHNAVSKGARDMRIVPKSDTYHDMAPLKETTIMAMSNLLSANVDAGLKYSLAMGYHEDMRTRAAFMQVLTNILNQGTEFETLAENVMMDRYEKLIDMLVEADLEVIMLLCDICQSNEASNVADSLLTAFEARGRVVPLLKASVEKEVFSTEHEATLFRSTTMATRLLSTFAKRICHDYVRSTLQPALEAINALPDEQTTWELDPQKINPGEELMQNKDNVIRATEILLNAICTSAPSAPPAFREELSMIADMVHKRFSEAKNVAVGSFVFLRLFGPVIVSPENAGLSKQATPRSKNIRKLLLQATRLMQNIANNVLFGSKETHMFVLNDFVTENIYRVTSFLRTISTVESEAIIQTESPTRMDQKIYYRIHRYLYDNLERMSRELATRKIKNDARDTQTLLEWKKTLDRLSTLLAQLGQPCETVQAELTLSRNYAITNSNHDYSEFIRRNNHRDLGGISTANFFYQSGVSKLGRPVFYWVPRNMDTENYDYELTIYYMLRVMEPHLNRPYEMVFDTTGFKTETALPSQWLSQFFQFIFAEVNDNLSQVYIFNPNQEFYRNFTRVARAIILKILKRSIFVSATTELYDKIAPSEIHLPKETMDLEKAPMTVFSPVTKITNLKTSSVPVIVKISQEHVQLQTVRKQEIFMNMYAVLNEVYHISEIDEIVALPNSKSENGGELLVKANHGKTSIVLSSSKRDAILALLRYNKNRYESTKPGTTSERAIRPNDVPGRLLNMALINTGSDDPGLRLAAYNLLYALSLSFRFDTGNQLLNARDLCIPANSTDFIVTISESLASTEQHLTLEFLKECLVGFSKSEESMRQLCLDYMAPWLRNLALYSRPTSDDDNKNLLKMRDILRLLIELTVSRSDMYKHVQDKIWKTLSTVDELINIILDAFVQYSVEHGAGSPQAEIMADTIVTLASISVRGKVISRLRRVLHRTSLRPCRSLTEHPAWAEIAVLLRFILMLSFNNNGPGKPYLPEIFHIVSLLVGTGPTLVRASVHELVVNVVHTLCTDMPQSEENLKKLQLLLTELCDSKNRVYFGLTKPHANAFTITQDTMTDVSETVSLSSLESIITLLLEAINIGAPSIDVANMWRARWMGLVASSAFQFNPSTQPRAFVVLGCLAQDEVDDDLIYQIIVALRGALAIFNETDSSLIVSIMMCLSRIINNLPSDSRYLQPLFWLAIALVQMNYPAISVPAIEFLQSVLRALDTHDLFAEKSLMEVLMEARVPFADISEELDNACGVCFSTNFSFAVTGTLLKGSLQSSSKDAVFQCLTTFLEIDSKRSMKLNMVEAHTLGYLAGLLPIAAKSNTLGDLLRLASINDLDLEALEAGSSYVRIFDTLEIPDNTTALLLVSLAVAMVTSVENETERLFLYKFLAEAAVSIPEVFSLVNIHLPPPNPMFFFSRYDSLLPEMNRIIAGGQNIAVIDAITEILVTACSEPVFTQSSGRHSQRAYLEELGFSAFCDATFDTGRTIVAKNAQLVSQFLGRMTE